MSNLLACILACISVRDKHDEGIKKMCSTGISFGRSKLLQSCSNFTLKPYTEQLFKATAIFARYLQCRYSKDLLFCKYIYRLGVLNGLQRESWRFGKNCPLSVKTIVYNSLLLSLFASQAGQCSVLCDHHDAWWGCKIKGLVYSHETDHCLS